MPTDRPLSWVRWLAWHGLPPDHVARLLDWPIGEVESRWPDASPSVPPSPPYKGPGTRPYSFGGPRGTRARRLDELGYDAPTIARVLGVCERALRIFLARGPSPQRRIKGPLAANVRRRHLAGDDAATIAEDLALEPAAVAAFLSPKARAPRRRPAKPGPYSVRRLVECGLPVGEIAERLELDAGTVAAFMDRLVPRQPHPRRRGPTLNRPRSVREQASLSSWPRDAGDDEGPPFSEPGQVVDIDGSPPRTDRPPTPEPAGEWGSAHGSVTGRRSPNAAMSDGEADRARALRARGVPRAEVAAMFGVSVATITRITRSETYRAVEIEHDQVVAPELPAIAAAEGPPPDAWTEPRRPGRRPPREHRDD